jgi:hypothetical protein
MHSHDAHIHTLTMGAASTFGSAAASGASGCTTLNLSIISANAAKSGSVVSATETLSVTYLLEHQSV